jgi:hypothetical protein
MKGLPPPALERGAALRDKNPPRVLTLTPIGDVISFIPLGSLIM